MMKIRKLKKSDDAVVGIVVAFLITGLIVIVVSTIQMVYIPKWMEQAEADHMETVADQFSQLKFSIDTQSVIKQTNMPISTSITLGNKEMPFLMSSRSYGNIDILSDECTVTIIKKGSSPLSYSLGTIKYSSKNSYFLNQAYIYEAGAVILSQSEGNTMSIKPAFSVKKGDNINISFTIINITTIEEKNSIGGYGTYPIQTEFSDNDTIPVIQNVSSIAIGTHYQNAWHKFINGTLRNQGLNNNGYGTDYTITLNERGITVKFTGNNIVNLDIKLIQIYAQVEPGWIENIKGT